MPEPLIAARTPCLVTLDEGKIYSWCRCGRSARQPFCDGSHRGSGFEPVSFSPHRSGEFLLCACKHTKRAPWCDGSHNNLSDSYEEASAEEISATAHFPVTPRDDGSVGKALLDGGCFVRTVDRSRLERNRNISWAPMIDTRDGAHCLSLCYLEADHGVPAIMAFPGSHVALFVLNGSGRITISGKEFPVSAEQGVYVGAGESFAIEPGVGSAAMQLTATLCPQSTAPTWPHEMSDEFNDAVRDRVFAVDPARREAMADRFYQVLIDDFTGAADMTQFLGEVPRSRAAAHRHLYEETITILSGSGWLWTESARAAVKPGDVIFLPRQQLHSLECTSDGGMRLVGVFFPAGSPAVNY